jgi:hypothetical protein
MDWYMILKQAHSGWRWIVLLLILITVVKALIGWQAKQKWTALDTRLLLYTRISVYIQVALGLLLYVMGPYWLDMRFTGEHVLLALLAVGGLEFGAGRAKKSKGARMFMFAFIGFFIALVLIYVALQAVGGLFT